MEILRSESAATLKTYSVLYSIICGKKKDYSLLIFYCLTLCICLLQETLTGFKWMGNRARELMDQGKTVLFAFEEAIGTVASTLQDAKHLCAFV